MYNDKKNRKLRKKKKDENKKQNKTKKTKKQIKTKQNKNPLQIDCLKRNRHHVTHFILFSFPMRKRSSVPFNETKIIQINKSELRSEHKRREATF